MTGTACLGLVAEHFSSSAEPASYLQQGGSAGGGTSAASTRQPGSREPGRERRDPAHRSMLAFVACPLGARSGGGWRLQLRRRLHGPVTLHAKLRGGQGRATCSSLVTLRKAHENSMLRCMQEPPTGCMEGGLLLMRPRWQQISMMRASFSQGGQRWVRESGRASYADH